MMRRGIMFNLFKVDNKGCIIYKSGFQDAAKCIISNQDSEITLVAEKEINNMFDTMIGAFEQEQKVVMYSVKRGDSDHISFSSINRFKIWLIENQLADSNMLILSMLDKHCKKKKIALPRLNIIFGYNNGNAIYNTDMYFNNTFDPDWLIDDSIKKAIKAIDKSEVIDRQAIMSPVFGIMPPTKLSGGVKTLMLIYNNPDMIFNASTCGDNCARWITRFAREKFFVINLYHAMQFNNKDFQAYILNDDRVIDSQDEIYFYVDRYCRRLQ